MGNVVGIEKYTFTLGDQSFVGSIPKLSRWTNEYKEVGLKKKGILFVRGSHKMRCKWFLKDFSSTNKIHI